jgi:hypothetical protein
MRERACRVDMRAAARFARPVPASDPSLTRPRVALPPPAPSPLPSAVRHARAIAEGVQDWGRGPSRHFKVLKK